MSNTDVSVSTAEGEPPEIPTGEDEPAEEDVMNADDDTEHDLEMLVDVTKMFANIATGKKAQANVGMALLAQQEKYRDQLNRYKDARMERLMMIRNTHRYVIEMAAEYFAVEPDVVMAGVIDYASNIELLDSLFAEGGRMGIMIYYQDGDPPEMETGRLDTTITGKFKRIYVTDGSEIKLGEMAVAAVRYHTKNVEVKNLNSDIFFATIDVRGGSNAIAGIYWLLENIYGPLIMHLKDWGQLNKTSQGQATKKEFLGDFNSFIRFIEDTKIDLECGLKFDMDLDLYDTYLSDPVVMRTSSLDPEIVHKVESIVFVWLRQIETTVTQANQLRREHDRLGPLVELVYWRRQLAKFMSIIEYTKTAECIMHIQCLMQGRSRLMKKWKYLDNAVTEACNEAQDIVKYLYALEKFCEPLYRCDPTKIPDYIPSLLYSIRMVFSTSRYYNTVEKVTALFVKVTNQMVYGCRAYLDENRTKSIWHYRKRDIIQKMKVCLDLYAKYYQCYQHTKKAMEEAGEAPFGLSEMHIFLKFETFKRRLEKIIDVLNITLKYSILQSSNIEDIDIYANKFKEFFQKISSQTYDPLDHRRDEFDRDYEQFKQNVVDTEWELEEFVGKSLETLTSVEGVLRLLLRFDKLNLSCLHMDERYLEAMEMFQKEIAMVRDRYNADRQNLTLAFNMPPFSGRIQWIRQLYKRITEPMEILKKRDRVIRHRKVQKCIQMYNSLACVFVHYEQIHHKAWFDNLDQVRTCLSVPLLVKHPETRMYVVNFDPYIFEAIRECEYMLKFDLEIPDVGQVIYFCKDKIMRTYESIKHLVEENVRVRKSIIKLFLAMMRPQLLQLENAFLPGFSIVSWTSMKIPEFFELIRTNIAQVERYVKEVTDLKDCRIDEALENVGHTRLINLPKIALYPNELLALNVQHRKAMAKELELKSYTIERAVFELINQFMDSITEPELQEGKYDWLDRERATKPITSVTKLTAPDEKAAFKEIDRTEKINLPSIHDNCVELFAYFNAKMIEALSKSMKLSLEFLKQRETVLSVIDAHENPLVKTNMELHIPNAIINPSLDEIQSYFNQLMHNTLDTMKSVTIWAQRDLDKVGEEAFKYEEESSKKNYYKNVYEQKEINRCIMSLQGSTMPLKADIQKLCQSYLRYSYLWAETREEDVLAFVAKNPLIVEIREEFALYDGRAAEIQDLPQSHFIGPIQVEMDRYKLALLVESNAWKHLLGKQLTVLYMEKLTEMVNFITDHQKILAKKITNLDDVRLAMACLERIRNNFIEMDMTLELMEEAFATFSEFKISVPVEQSEKVDTLRYNFNNMLANAKSVQEDICLVQGPFQAELIAGVTQFQKDLQKFAEDYEANGPMVPGLAANEASDRVLLFQARFDDLCCRNEMYSSGEKLFGMEVQEYPILIAKKKEFNLLSKLYGLYVQVNASIDGYFDILWSDLEIETIIEELADFQNRCRKLPKGMKDWPAFLELKKKIDDFNETCPLLELMAQKAMKERHWKRIEAATKHKFDLESPTFTLKNVMEAPLLENKDDIEDICISATKEKDIEAKLKQVIADWAIVELKFAAFKTRGELLLKGQETGEIIAMLEDSLMILNSLLSNRYNAPYKKDIQLWVHKLVTTSEILERWLQVQNLWVYLEAVFVGGDISKQLPAESKRFNGIDRSWVKIMFRARDIVNAVECCTGDETMGQLLPYLLEQLETCQKSLTGYLESKRLCFPRFFFISDPVLLEILGQSSNPQSIQPHLLSLFDAVASVEFDEKKDGVITAMLSDLNERVQFEKPVTCQGGVEIWLNTLLNVVRDTIKNIIAQMGNALKDPEYDFVKNFPNFCGQAGLIGIQLLWTKEAEIALLRSRVDKQIMKKTNQRFLDLLNSFIDLTTKNLSKVDRIRFETMVTIHLHQRDIFDDLVRLRIRTKTDFEWQKQARFYWDEDTDDVWVRITDVDFLYQNEYLGVTERLAITPLTDRCYITLAQAIGMNMGGAPAGPAGTGKTETTKDMGRALGKLVVVFNCSDQMDFRGLGRIFKGLAQSGSWGCFDEFNRIELPVLSVAAQQIYIVLTARKERKTMFIFSDGDNVAMNFEFGIFLTMNPGYAGRQELPENLKIMFRTVAMMVPDRQIIIRVKLASCGFKDNSILARKFYTLYKLCEEQLSKQVHYDFGLRNILSVLRTLGAQKRADPSQTEETVVMRVLRDMNVSKLVDEDEPLFMSLIEDMFPGIKLSTSTYKELQKAIAHQTVEMGIMNHAQWNLKVIQFYETSLVRHGLMILGPTGSGKTKCLHCLMRSLTECGKPHREMRMNPKAITAPQMFGRLDVATNDWTDGIFSTLWRKTLKVKKTEYVWLILDGPVDAVWIENLNSVLDDNKTLTLANGDRIVMAPNCKLCFEPDNVDNASPATVSRMGMVFVSASVLKWQPMLDGWLLTTTPHEADVFRPLFHAIYDDLHTFIQVKLKAKMAIVEALYIRQCCDIITGLLDHGEEAKTFTDKTLERFFLFALMWSLGAVLELHDRDAMEEFILAHPSRLEWPKIREGQTIFEYLVGDDGKWQHWSERVEEFLYPPDAVIEYSSILVPNIDNVRSAFLMHLIAKQNKAVLFIGEQGTAKTVMIKGYVAAYDPDYQVSKSINFSSATSPNMFQRIIESYVDKRVGTTYGPPAGKKMTVFIDDINMPVVNEWGDQITNEIVRQLMEGGGFYSLDKPGDFSTILDIQFLGAMNHPGGGRNDIPPRLKRQFCIFNCTLPSNKSMDKIFSQIGEGYFCPERFTSEEVVDFLPRLVPLTRHVWQQTKIKMLPTPAKFHYVFNLRDLSRIWQGILTIQNLECQKITTLLKLWRHECIRVIADRFVNKDDTAWFLTNLRRQAEEELEEYYMYYDDSETYFVDFLREPPEATGEEPEGFSFDPPKIYEEMPSYAFVLEKVFAYESQYNEFVRGSNMDMVFFHDALVNLMIISRIIRTPRGNALLVGVGGSGKQSLTRLASFMAGYITFQITITRAYSVSNLMEDLKFLYRSAGAKGCGTTFVFTDNEIKDEAFLEFVNNLIGSGEIANLFAKDELDEIQTDLIPVMKKDMPKRIPTNDNLYDFFISRSRNNLHVVLCFSPVGEKFRSRALKFPGLISGCTMKWFNPWPKDALIAVGNYYLGKFPIVCSPEVKLELIEMTGYIQDQVAETCALYFERFRRQTHVTPKSFLSFLSGYKKIYDDKHKAIQVLAKRMNVGLAKLVEAGESVEVLRKDLEIKEKDIAVANAEAEAILEDVMVASEKANVVKEEANSVKERASALVEVISADQKAAEIKLAVAKPALDAAEAALQTIKAGDIATVRKLGKPPYLITLIMDAVLILFKKKIEPVRPDFDKNFLFAAWSESLKCMSDTKFLYNLQNYPKDTINAEICDLLVPYFQYPIYTFENAKQACGNVAGLIQWTLSMATFYGINKDVLPLKANLARQTARYNTAKKELDAAMTLLAEKEAEVAECQERFDKAMLKKQEVQEIANKCKAKMDAAKALIDGLSGERIRWTEQSAQFKSEIERLVGDVLLLTGFLSYTGPFNQEFRNTLQNSWIERLIDLKIPVTLNIVVTECLIDTATIGEWNLQGLPTDDLSIQNGIIVTKAARYPLLIDPQTQGKTWIKNMEKENSLIVTSLNHKYFRNHVEDAVSLGFPLIIEDIGEELDPCLDNILEKNHIRIGTTYKVKLGDKEIDVNDAFRMYMTTKLPNPSYTPEVSARTSIIDFTVTIKGLEDQLLGRVIVTEKNELEKERTNLITDVTANKRKMQELEQNLLYKLTTTKGSLVDDESVIGVLNVTKNTAAEVKDKLDIAKITEIKINAAREEFRPVATRGSVLYFLIVNMAMVNSMYQTSLAQFLERFDLSMAHAEKSPITARRIAFIIECMTFEIYKYKCRGLYETHKYLFLLLMTLKIDLEKGFVTHEEFQNLIKGGAALDLNACPPKSAKWITDITWLNLVQLSTLRQYQFILNQVTDNDKGWKRWFDSDAPEESPIPDGYNNFDVFRKLLIVRAWCPDRTLSQSRKYIAASLGPKYVDPVILNMDVLHGESRAATPLICFLSMGSDPTTQIEQLAKKLETRCKPMSMGQGQEVHARKLLAQAMDEGFWALLQNCHLGLDYMNEVLTLLIDSDKMSNVHPDYRLWLTTEGHPSFPISLLQLCIKFTNEPPAGIRAGLKRTYTSMNQDFLDYSDSWQYLPLVYAISFLHTVVQERRKFGPLGWNIPYEFNSADWLASCMFVQNHLEDLDKDKSCSWVTIRYMLGEVQYGGRVTDDYDKRLLNTFAKVWFCENMFSPEFNFYKGYRIMRHKQIINYLDEIETMPVIDPPQAYGLHPNADITYQSSTTTEMLFTIVSIQPKESSAGGGETRESIVARQTKEMLEKLPPNYDFFEVKERLIKMGILNSMTIFLRQEIDRMQKVIKLVRATLLDLLLAIDGIIIMNEALRDALDNIYDARVPNVWKRGSWVSSTLGFWFTELLERNAQFRSWCFVARPVAFWMTGFFNPQGFLTAMKQEVARAHKGWALDQVALHNDVTKLAKEDTRSAPNEGVYIWGLYLDGAGWDKRGVKLCESTNKVLYTVMPIVHVYAINDTNPKDPKLYQNFIINIKPDPDKLENNLDVSSDSKEMANPHVPNPYHNNLSLTVNENQTCPVYKKPNRTDLTFITPLWLQTVYHPDHWILRGVALLCDIK